jgi:hypothetical protein
MCDAFEIVLTAHVFVVIPFYLQSVLVHSANCVKMYTMACERVFISAPLYWNKFVVFLCWLGVLLNQYEFDITFLCYRTSSKPTRLHRRLYVNKTVG